MSQLTALFTSEVILVSSTAVNSFNVKATGHMAPSSRFALSLKPSVEYLVLNFFASWKKQMTFCRPSHMRASHTKVSVKGKVRRF